ncbi:hypothetical protein Tco_0769398 [Tanacetum coccineum]|uniref:Uncharacterized protein n=1 Tax=Tanacetum coccineum TaxID=301880 RepID=A0ABQ4ZA67_9ASTR
MESSPLMNAMAVKNVVENESHFSLEVVDQDLSSLAMFTKHLMGEQRKRVVRSQWQKRVGEGKEEFIGGIRGGSFAKCSMVSKDGLGGDGFVVDGGRSPSTSSKDGEDGGVENKSLMGSRLIVTGECKGSNSTLRNLSDVIKVNKAQGMIHWSNALGYSTFRCDPDLGVLQIGIRAKVIESQVVMSSTSFAVTYTSVYTNSKPGRVFWGADEEISDGGIPRVIVLGYDGLLMHPDMILDYVPEPIYPEYIPLEDEHEFPAEEQPLSPVDSPTAESPGYVTESDPDEDLEEYEDDETEDGPIDYPLWGGMLR